MIKTFLCVCPDILIYSSIHFPRGRFTVIRTVTLPHLEPFGISDGLELKVCDPFAYTRVFA